ncbi:hypothetical protein GRF29_77g1154638 [Pseudopithomyces chartarum]|uniref:Cell wall protein YJL171C/Tos1 N-terminal domain-containing protein n=1 Tax=Pseudopithomyces chartarum TaxID=1892770 RepID=A0AAN6LVT9_9PLEO|nr:hypothetical protein GRF29_77g1154638 [Pseudopithomyces chartarum]
MTYALLGTFCLLCLLIQAAHCRTAAQLCRGTAERADDGNWYCAEVTAITYKNISQAGEYNRTTRVNPKTGLCDHEPVAYSGVGPFTPLIGELSMHLRGPINVSQIAVYKLPDVSTSKRLSVGRSIGWANKRRRKQKAREVDGTIRSIWHSFWHHTHNDPNTEAGVPSTTTLVGDSTSESKHFTTEQTTVAKTSPTSASTTVVSTIEQTIATTVVHTVFASATQPDGSEQYLSQSSFHTSGYSGACSSSISSTCICFRTSGASSHPGSYSNTAATTHILGSTSAVHIHNHCDNYINDDVENHGHGVSE